MPSNTKNSTTSVAFTRAINNLQIALRDHFEYAEVEYVDRTNGRMLHNRRCDSTLEEAYLAILAKKPAVHTINVSRVMSAYEEYVEVLEMDYCHKDLLWRGGSMGISESASRNANKAESELDRLDKRVRSALKDVERAVDAHFAAPVVATPRKGVSSSPKAKRAAAKAGRQ